MVAVSKLTGAKVAVSVGGTAVSSGESGVMLLVAVGVFVAVSLGTRVLVAVGITVFVAVGVQVRVVVGEGVSVLVEVAVGVTGVLLGNAVVLGISVGGTVGKPVAVLNGIAVGNSVAVGKKVLVGKDVGDDGTIPEIKVLVGVGDRTAGKVGGSITSPVRGAVVNKKIPPQ